MPQSPPSDILATPRAGSGMPLPDSSLAKAKVAGSNPVFRSK